jgi:MFS family permease
MAFTLARATIAWQVYEISGSTFHLGLIGLAQFVPALLVSLVAGAVADSLERRKIAMVAQTIPALGTGVLAWFTLQGAIGLPLIYLMVILIAGSSAFEQPARHALLPQLVPRELFPRAVTVNGAVHMFALMTGPVVMGFLIDARGVWAPYALHAALLVASLAALSVVRPAFDSGERRAVSLQSIREGLSFVRRERVVLGSMILDMFAVLFGGAVALLPVYAIDILKVGARGYGLLSSGLEIGAAIMAVVLIVIPPFKRTGRALLIGIGLFAVATIVFGLSRSFYLSMAAYTVAGMADFVSVVTRNTAVQLSTPDHLRGRVSSVSMVFIGASNQLGLAESGFVAALTSPTFAVVSGGLGALVVVGLVALRNPALRRYEAVSDSV